MTTSSPGELEKLQLLAVETHLNSQVVEREEEIRGLLLSLLAKQHVLLLGPPGTGKSLTANLLTQSVTDSNLFEILMTRFTKPEEVFGPPSLPDLKAGKYAFIKEGTIRESQIAFLDEIFKANSAILNSLLKIVNERVFHNGSCGAEKVPLMSLIGASNELPQGEDLSALVLCVSIWSSRYKIRTISGECSIPLLRSVRPYTCLLWRRYKSRPIRSRRIPIWISIFIFS